MTPDLKGLHYLTAPNQVQLDRPEKSPMIENRGDMFSYNPYQYRCCQHNVAFGWPYYAESLWAATSDNGLAAVLYAASSVKAQVGDGTRVQIAEETSYGLARNLSGHFLFGQPTHAGNWNSRWGWQPPGLSHER